LAEPDQRPPLQGPEPALAGAGPASCPRCGTQLASGLYACPSCHTLIHGERLKQLAAAAEAATRDGQPSLALESWRQAIDLLPPGSRQYEVIKERITTLARETELQLRRGGKAVKRPTDARRWTGLAGIGAAVMFLLTKGKLLATGLANLGTVLTMAASLGLYFSLWGGWFALGLVLSIYVHEMGHVAAMRSLGFAASAPMFIPGLGAFIRLSQRPLDPREDARIGLGGPWWGLGASVACLALFGVTRLPVFAALAHVGAIINAFNLIPLMSLDGSRGFAPLGRGARVLLTMLLAATALATGERLWFLPALAAVYRCFDRELPKETSWRTWVEFAALVVLLGAAGTVGGAFGEPIP